MNAKTSTSRYLNSEPRWVLALAFSSANSFTKAVDAYIAHHKGWATDLNRDRHSLLSIWSNAALFITRSRASEFVDLLVATLTSRGTHRLVLIGKVQYLEPVGLDKPFSQVGLHAFSQGSDFFQPVALLASRVS